MKNYENLSTLPQTLLIPHILGVARENATPKNNIVSDIQQDRIRNNSGYNIGDGYLI